MRIIVDVNSFDELMEHSWSGALDNLKMIDKYGLQDEFMSYLEEMFCDSTPTDTEINDFIWFMEQPTAEKWIAEYKSLSNIDDIDELLDIAKDLCYSDAVATIRDYIHANKENELWDYLQENNYDDNLDTVFNDIDNIELEEEE